MQIELLYIEGCPNVTTAVDRVKNVLREHGFDSAVAPTKVGDYETAIAVGFLGSPTVRINSVDIEPAARLRTDFGLMCRTYGGSGVPSEGMIRSAIMEAMIDISR